MKRFDLRQIMRDAHRTYKYVGKKQGKTFGEVLKSTWKLAKLNVTMQEELARQQEESVHSGQSRKSHFQSRMVRLLQLQQPWIFRLPVLRRLIRTLIRIILSGLDTGNNP